MHGIKKMVLVFCLGMAVASCGNQENVPDVSGIAMQTELKRFDQDFFVLDTLHLQEALMALQKKYPNFLPQYLQLVLGIAPQSEMAGLAVNSFLQSYRPVYEAANTMAAKQLPAMEKQLKLGLQLMQFYVPHWKAEQPFEIVSFVGPMDAYEAFAIGDYGEVRTTSGVGIALQFHLGADAQVYEGGRQAGILFDYQTRRFTPEMMVVNAMKAVIEDALPYKATGSTLVEEMIEKGKRLYLLQLTLPYTPDSLQMGYTQEQWEGCLANEALIWNFFVKNDLLYGKEPLINQNYLKDGPNTPELGQGAPGYIALFTGRRIVEQYMKKNKGTTMADMLKMPALELLEKSAYKP